MIGYNLLVKNDKQAETVQRLQQVRDLYTIRVARNGMHNTPCLGDEYWSSTESDATARMHEHAIANSAHAPLYEPSLAAQGEQLFTLIEHWKNSFDNLCDQTKYRMKFADVEYGWSNNRPTIKVPLEAPQLARDEYQDGSKMHTPIIKYHGTRSTILRHILEDGIASSSESHGQTGLWANSQLAWTLDWNSTVVEPFPGTSLQLLCETEHVCSNRRVRVAKADSTRCVIKLMSHTPSVRLTDVFVLVPSSGQLQFRQSLLEAIGQAVWEASRLAGEMPTVDRKYAILQTITLVEHRASYAGFPESFQPGFGGPYNSVSPVAAFLSLELARFVQGLSVDNVNTRIRRFRQIHLCAIPKGLIQWMNCMFPDVSRLFSDKAPDHIVNWRITPMINVQRWGYLANSLPDGPRESEC